METAKALLPREVLGNFEYAVRQLHARPGLPVHTLPEGIKGLDAGLAEPVLLRGATGRLAAREILPALGNARLLLVDQEDEGGSPALRATLANHPMPGATWLSAQLRLGPDGKNEELTTRIGLPMFGQEVIENRWSQVGRALRHPISLNGERLADEEDGLYVPLRLVMALTGLLTALRRAYRLGQPDAVMRVPRQVAPEA